MTVHADLCDRHNVRARRREGWASVAWEADHENAGSTVVRRLDDIIYNSARTIDKACLHPQVCSEHDLCTNSK